MESRRRLTGLKGSWDWLEFAAQLPANPQPLSNVSASFAVYTGRCILTGLSVQNNGTAAGGVNILDGVDATGTAVIIQPLAAQAAAQVNLPGQGVLCEIGVFVQITTAILRGSVYIIPLWHSAFTSPGD